MDAVTRHRFSEAGRVYGFLSAKLAGDANDILECYAMGAEHSAKELRAALMRASRTTLVKLLHALLEGEKRRAFSSTGGLSDIAEDLVSRIEDELWDRRRRDR